MTEVLLIVMAVVAVALAALLVRRYMGDAKAAASRQDAERVVGDARREADAILKEASLEAKEQVHRVRQEVEDELADRRNEVAKSEQRITQREELLEQRAGELERREQSLIDREADNLRLNEELKDAVAEQKATLERISGITAVQAKEMLLKQAEDESRHEMAKMVRQVEEEARREADRRARNILSVSIQRTAANHVAETTVSVVALPSDDMKGRIIGREGRNIRALENLTGIDFIIDDTPEAVVLSGFDGVRREIARLTLTKLLADGRIHPARIEEMFGQASAEVDATIEEAGEQACFDTDVHGLAPELVKLLGRLKFRTSYGQNVLNHSIEVAHLAGIMAAELGANPKIARRAGLLHDIGKAVDHEVDGSHAADLGAARREVPRVAERHPRHRGAPPGRRAADRSRRCWCRPPTPSPRRARAPGARRSRATSSGSSRSRRSPRARRASRSATPCRRDARCASWSSRPRSTTTRPCCSRSEIAREIEDQLDYPGQIRVTVIRESRAVEYAK